MPAECDGSIAVFETAGRGSNPLVGTWGIARGGDTRYLWSYRGLIISVRMSKGCTSSSIPEFPACMPGKCNGCTQPSEG
jgi:hypothetical protein